MRKAESDWLPAFSALADSLLRKGDEFDDVIKSGRTHLQDAMPIRLGQEFAAYGGTLQRGMKRVEEAADYLRELGIGGSAVGTGVNVEPEYQGLERCSMSLTMLVRAESGSKFASSCRSLR